MKNTKCVHFHSNFIYQERRQENVAAYEMMTTEKERKAILQGNGTKKTISNIDSDFNAYCFLISPINK